MTLQQTLEELAASASDHVLGVAVTDIQTGRALAALNAERPFQLASMFKVPVLVAALQQVDAGTLDLAQRYTLRDDQKLIGSGILSYLDAGLQPTLRDLLTLMIITSDNTATDIVLDLLGGVATVERTLRELGIDAIHVRHTTRDLLWAVFPSHELALTDAEIVQLAQAHKLVRQDDTVSATAQTNTGTPAALNNLLHVIARGDALSPESTTRLQTILKRQTYNQRLPLTWPDNIDFAHKTGTLSNMRGDFGIAYFPAHTLAISAIVQAEYTPLPLSPAIERAGDALLAQVGAAIWQWAATHTPEGGPAQT